MLKNRVKSYFQSSTVNKDNRIKALIKDISDFEIIIVPTESEALLLECNLIKKHSPKYNVLLRDDKTFPFIRINNDHLWPRPTIVRRPRKNNDIYLGPYSDVKSLHLAYEAACKVFPFRKCSDSVLESTKEPCQYYYMKQCIAPCVRKIENNIYKNIIMSWLLSQDKII